METPQGVKLNRITFLCDYGSITLADLQPVFFSFFVKGVFFPVWRTEPTMKASLLPCTTGLLVAKQYWLTRSVALAFCNFRLAITLKVEILRLDLQVNPGFFSYKLFSLHGLRMLFSDYVWVLNDTRVPWQVRWSAVTLPLPPPKSPLQGFARIG